MLDFNYKNYSNYWLKKIKKISIILFIYYSIFINKYINIIFFSSDQVMNSNELLLMN